MIFYCNYLICRTARDSSALLALGGTSDGHIREGACVRVLVRMRVCVCKRESVFMLVCS